MYYFIFIRSSTILFKFVTRFICVFIFFLVFSIVGEILDFVLCTGFGKSQDTQPSIIFELSSIDGDSH